MPAIRKAAETDIPQIIKLYNEQLSLGPTETESTLDPSSEDFRRVLKQMEALPGCEIFVAEEEGTVTGTAMVMIVPNLSHNGLPWAIVENVS